MRQFYMITLMLFQIMLITSCSSASEKLILKERGFSDLSGWNKDNHLQALQVFLKSCEKFKAKNSHKKLHESGVGGVYKDWRKPCKKARQLKYTDDRTARLFFEQNFTPYLASNFGNSEGLFTGYYEIALSGNHKKNDKFKYPIYKTPSDYVAGKKYHSRGVIESGILKGKNLEILWVDDPVQLFFLHVQGSGKVVMQDGSVVSVGYAAKNHHAYSSIGRYVIDKGYVKKQDMNAESLKQFLYDNPDKIAEITSQNDSYIFFRKSTNKSPVGGQGVEITPLRSIAIDKKYIAYGVPLWLDVALNKTQYYGEKLQRLMIAQDTGSAIKGVVRGDIFFGFGKGAEDLANHQNSKGSYYLLLPDGVAHE